VVRPYYTRVVISVSYRGFKCVRIGIALYLCVSRGILVGRVFGILAFLALARRAPLC
jgi:hypothetical protein